MKRKHDRKSRADVGIGAKEDQRGGEKTRKAVLDEETGLDAQGRGEQIATSITSRPLVKRKDGNPYIANNGKS